MYRINKDFVLVFLIIVLLWCIFRSYKQTEAFDGASSEFLPVGADRYGLRGDLLNRSSIDNWYASNNRQIMLNNGEGEMWQANGTPPSFGIKDCRKVKCPINGEYDHQDTCWKCGSDCQDKITIPDMHPHVKI
jgi:hypothetical protein